MPPEKEGTESGICPEGNGRPHLYTGVGDAASTCTRCGAKSPERVAAETPATAVESPPYEPEVPAEPTPEEPTP